VTIGAPDFQDPRQPQPVNDEVLSTTLAVGSTTLTQNLAKGTGIYEYYGITCTPPMACLIEVSLALPGAYNAFTLYRQTPAAGNPLFIIPATGFLETQPTLILTVSTPVVTTAMPITVYGYRVFPGGLRYDGLYPPQNSQAFTIPATAGFAVVGPTLPSPQRTLVGMIVPPAVILGAAAGGGYVQATVGGVNVNIATGAGAAGQPMTWNVPQIGQGVLCDAGTQVTVDLPTLASGVAGIGLYDIVT